MTHPHQDSTGRHLQVGDVVRWRGELYTIRAFGEVVPGRGYRIEFVEPLHVEGDPDEVGVDFVWRGE